MIIIKIPITECSTPVSISDGSLLLTRNHTVDLETTEDLKSSEIMKSSKIYEDNEVGVIDKIRYLNGAEVTYSCDADYILAPSISSVLTCVSGGNWSPAVGKCYPS